MKHIRIASRASKLALVQANYTRDLLLNLTDNVEISIVEISTKGDRDRSDFLYKSDSVGFFTSEVENAILDRRADIAVHSLKDLPTTIADGLVIAAMPKRESPADALVSSAEVTSIADLPRGATVGTSSLRRIAQLKNQRQGLNCVPLRGNVETRVGKVASGDVDAAVLACAGLNRLGLAGKISAILSPEEFLPAPAQGALAVQIRNDDTELAQLLAKLDDKPTRIAAEAERRVLAAMHGGCSIPLGVYATVAGQQLNIDAMIADIDGGTLIRRSASTTIDKSDQCADQLAQEMLKAGGDDILKRIRYHKTQ